MSAENWALCPQCEKAEGENKAFRANEAKESYGKIPEAEYLELIVKNNKPIILEETLREDYEIGIFDEGLGKQLLISYSARCENEDCDFKIDYKHAELIEL